MCLLRLFVPLTLHRVHTNSQLVPLRANIKGSNVCPILLPSLHIYAQGLTCCELQYIDFTKFQYTDQTHRNRTDRPERTLVLFT